MSKLFDDASLAMIPSAYKDGKLYSIRPTDGSGDFTFSRGSNLAATRVNEQGLIEKGRENLLLQSNQFDTTWGSNGTLTSGQSGYDGSSDAWLFNYTTDPSIAFVSNTNSGVQTISLYAKGSVSNGLRIYSFGSLNCQAYFDLNIGSVENTSNIIDATIEDKGNGWYRCSMTFNQTNSSINFYLSNNANLNATSGSIYIQDAQLEQGLVATEVITTGASTAQAGILEDMPRLDYSGGASCPSLLLEPQRTNLFAQSENFTFYWVSNGGTRTPNQSTSPDGGLNATEFLFNSYASGVYTPSFAAGTYTMSIFIKPISGDGLIRFGLGLDNSKLNTSTLEITNQGTGNGSLIDYGNGWYRFITTITTSSSTSANIYNLNSNNVTAYIYGAQLEQGSYPTSYIPTYGSSVTRGGEGSVNRLSSPITFAAGEDFTLFFDGEFNSQVFSSMIMGGRTTSSSYWWIQNYQAGKISSNLGSEMANWTGMNLSINTRYKMLVKRDSNVIKFFLNGVALTTNQSAGVSDPFTFQSLGYGFNDSGSYAFSGKAYQALIFPTALTDSECIALTSL